MMRKEYYKLEKVTLNLRKGDFHYLHKLHKERVSPSKVIRHLIIGHIRRTNEIAAERGGRRYLTQTDLERDF